MHRQLQSCGRTRSRVRLMSISNLGLHSCSHAARGPSTSSIASLTLDRPSTRKLPQLFVSVITFTGAIAEYSSRLPLVRRFQRRQSSSGSCLRSHAGATPSSRLLRSPISLACTHRLDSHTVFVGSAPKKCWSAYSSPPDAPLRHSLVCIPHPHGPSSLASLSSLALRGSIAPPYRNGNRTILASTFQPLRSQSP